jgi:hypothetical protein
VGGAWAQVDRSEDMPRLVEHFVPPLVDYVLADYQSNHPDTRDPEATPPPFPPASSPVPCLLAPFFTYLCIDSIRVPFPQ